MKGFLEGLGLAFVILALCFGIKGCLILDKPFIGVNGSFIDTRK